MKKITVALLMSLALTACQEDDAPESTGGETSSSESAPTETPAENTATADDGAGAMDGATSGETAPAETSSTAASSSEVTQDAIDGCIDALRGTEGVSGGTVTSTEFSEANSLVMLEDSSGTAWRCLVSNDGSNATVEAAENTATADDGGGAMDGAAQSDTSSTGNASDLSDFVGARGGQAEGGLMALGFESIRSEGLTTWWFNRETGACARITTSEGVFAEIEMLPAEDC
ncbi:hypothetical protein [Ovoidimarina sediminis]|uniref:hypothetical protein n=1 Tax=Ovoidimarina sediminis TaxID=3079856 RepID=UPI002911AB06|nr:hypothetical protein [Rhodophyticola sp. MJ-SS7]MDU8944257.1 hypothetical protein [Rhodophyticola sp. MJ-SS7]